MAGAKDSLHSQVAVVHLCEIVGGALRLSHEGLDLRYRPLDDVPEWHGNHEKIVRAAYVMWTTGSLAPAVSE